MGRGVVDEFSPSGTVVVVGGVNVDLLVQVPRRPRGGETAVASAYRRRCGGKGANQAAAAALAGASVIIVGTVGNDVDGQAQVADLRRCGVGVDLVAVSPARPTGLAMITVTPDGENAIVVALGANELTTAEYVSSTVQRWHRPDVVVGQAELGAETLDAVAAAAGRCGSRLVINDAPVVKLARETLRLADPLVVNEHEAQALADGDTSVAPRVLAAQLLKSAGARSVVITLGQQGAALATVEATSQVPAEPVSVVDTTGAGDTFVGSLAAYLAADLDLTTAVKQASVAAARCVTWVGARQPST